MKKTIVVSLSDLNNYPGDGNELICVEEAFKSGFAGSPYRPAGIAALFEGKSGHREVKFKHKELFLRFSQAGQAAQKVFIERTHELMEREETKEIFIEIVWSLSSERKKTIKVVETEHPGPRELVFDMA